MNRRRTKTANRHRIEQPTPGSSANVRNRLTIATILFVSLGLGAFFVERLTRPSGTNVAAVDIPRPASAARTNALIPPPRAAPTYVEIAAEGKQLGKEIAEQFPDNPRALAIAGSVQFTFGNPDQVQDDWQRTIELDPQSREAWLGLAKTAHKLGDFDRAVQHMRRLGDVAPELAESQVFFLADSLLNLGRPQEVVDTLEKLGESTSLPGGASYLGTSLLPAWEIREVGGTVSASPERSGASQRRELRAVDGPDPVGAARRSETAPPGVRSPAAAEHGRVRPHARRRDGPGAQRSQAAVPAPGEFPLRGGQVVCESEASGTVPKSTPSVPGRWPPIVLNRGPCWNRFSAERAQTYRIQFSRGNVFQVVGRSAREN